MFMDSEPLAVTVVGVLLSCLATAVGTLVGVAWHDIRKQIKFAREDARATRAYAYNICRLLLSLTATLHRQDNSPDKNKAITDAMAELLTMNGGSKRSANA